MPVLLSILLILTSVSTLFAQENTRSLKPVIVTANVPSKGDAFLQPTQINVLQGREKQIREKAALGQTLDHLAGVDVISTGGQVGKPVIRGLSGERIRIISNGVAVDHQQFDARHAPNIDPYLSERIEVIQGPASILYGSGALGGAVDIQSLPLDFAKGDSFEYGGGTLLGYATNNRQFDRGLKAKARNDKWVIGAGLIKRNGEKIRTPDDVTYYPDNPPSDELNNTPAYTGKLPFTDFDQTNRQFGIGYNNDGDEYKLRYTKYFTRQNFLLAPEAGEPTHGAHQRLENNELQFSSRVAVNGNVTFVPTFSWQNNLRHENHEDEEIDVEFDLYTTRLISEHKKLGILDGGKIGFEHSYKSQKSRGNEQLSPGGDVNNYAIFAFQEKQIDKTKLQFGLRHDWREAIAKEGKTETPTGFSGDVKRKYSAFSGSIGGSYQFYSDLVAALNVSRGFRAPTLFELFSGGMHTGISAVQSGNADLKEERSLNTDLSLRWRSGDSKAVATYYRNKIGNYIYLNDTGATQGGLPVFELRQDDVVIQGFELDASTFVSDRVEVRGVIDLIDSRNLRTGDDVPLIPSNEFRLETTYYAPDLGRFEEPYFRASASYNSSKRVALGEPFSQYDSENFGTGSTDNYTLLDLSAGFAFDLGYQNVKRAYVDFEVQNVTDESYRDFLDSYKGYSLGQGRNFMIKLRVPFGFQD